MRWNARGLHALIALTTCALVGCSTEPTGTAGLVPLAKGTTWTYRAADTTIGASTNTLGSPAPDTTFTVTVARDTSALGIVWGVFDKSLPIASSITANAYWANRSEGLYSLDAIPGFPGTGRLMFSYPSAQGVIATTTFGIIRTTTLDTLVKVPAGTFHCVQYDYVDSSPQRAVISSVFISPGLGVVKRILVVATQKDANGIFIARRDRQYQMIATNVAH